VNHSSVHLVPPPRITTQEANAAHVAALEAEIVRLRAGIAGLRQAPIYAEDCTLTTCYCYAAETNARRGALAG
jgi:hypothetical protein